MKQKIGTCIECNKPNRSINSRGLCSMCVYKKNHGGKSQVEVLVEKQRLKPRKSFRVNGRIKAEKLERRRIKHQKDRELYLYIFNTRPHKCEECDCDLPDVFEIFDATFERDSIVCISQYSHIITKGSRPDLRWHKKNINRLCPKCHDKWEFGDRESMRIYEPNQIIIQEILREEKTEV